MEANVGSRPGWGRGVAKDELGCTNELAHEARCSCVLSADALGRSPFSSPSALRSLGCAVARGREGEPGAGRVRHSERVHGSGRHLFQ